ncbi:MAG: hypothetical protein K0S44_1007 [Bacteroidetes bacterium]|jgi:hypothetical protein|nr:hypothetical protein [Bacteroidota bacterium]
MRLNKSSGSSGVITNVILGIMLAGTIALILFSAFLINNDYSTFCHYILEKLDKLHKKEYFKEEFLPEYKFNIIRIAVIISAIASLSFSYFLIRKRKTLELRIQTFAEGVRSILSSQKTFITNIKPSEKYILFSILSVQALYFSFLSWSLPISYDEAWTYLNFTSKSVLTSASYYPAPNNHVFYSILTNLTDFFPLNDPKIKMRSLNVIFSLLTSYCFFKLLCKFFNTGVAFITLILFTFSYPLTLYGIQARGYELLILFTLITTYSLISYINEPNRKYLYIYGIAVSLGFYTIPSFLYPFISLQLFLLAYTLKSKNFRVLKAFIQSGVVAGVIVSILYTPIFFISGIHSITSNSYVQSISIHEVLKKMPGHIHYTSNWLFGLTNGGEIILILIILSLLFAIKKSGVKKLKTINLLMIFLLLLPPVFMILQRVIPFERTWTYLSIPLFFGIANIFDWINLKKKVKYLVSILITGYVIFFSFTFPSLYKRMHVIDYQADELFKKISLADIHSVSSNNILMTDILVYKVFVKQNETIKVEAIINNSHINSDLLIVNKNSYPDIPNLSDYISVSSNDFVTLYKKAN